ncbi:MAG TPA: proton-conducting transporter membrane subunit, partial [Bacteroidia bacterium]|nr:proton-conducting transporter membrane subunit [Bacteroidia bacterium]
VMMFVFWELVGVSSYLLIGHWYEKASAADAAKKAFLVNRIGDFGFMAGILLVWILTGSIYFDEIAKA